MLERLILAGTVTCLLYLSLKLGHHSGIPESSSQPISYATSDSLVVSFDSPSP